jgi:hypothetical protein
MSFHNKDSIELFDLYTNMRKWPHCQAKSKAKSTVPYKKDMDMNNIVSSTPIIPPISHQIDSSIQLRRNASYHNHCSLVATLSSTTYGHQECQLPFQVLSHKSILLMALNLVITLDYFRIRRRWGLARARIFTLLLIHGSRSIYCRRRRCTRHLLASTRF